MLVSIKTAAVLLELSPSHIRRMIARGRFPSYRMGNRILRVDPDEIKAANRMSHKRAMGEEGAGREGITNES